MASRRTTGCDFRDDSYAVLQKAVGCPDEPHDRNGSRYQASAIHIPDCLESDLAGHGASGKHSPHADIFCRQINRSILE